MNSSKFRLTLDLHSAQSQYSIPVMLADTSVTLLINITDGGIPYRLEDDCYASITIKRPNGTTYEDVCAVKNNSIIEYHFTEHTCVINGIHYCDISLFDGKGERIGSPWFTMVVNETVSRRDDLEISEDDYTLLDSVAAEESKRKTAEELRVEAETERQSNEEVRQNSENYRNLNEEARVGRENARITNEDERIANERARVTKDRERDDKIAEALEKSSYAADNSDEALFQAENALNNAGDAKRNSIIAEANARYAMNQSDSTRTSLINLTAQVAGIGRTYVVPTFSLFINFLKKDYSVELKEDRDGDGTAEVYHINIDDLKSGDNIIITEKGVSDFWFEKNMALTEFESYKYEGVDYSLGSIIGGAVVGGAHVLETDYSVIEGHAISAAASANESRNSETNAKKSEKNIESMVDELFFDQIAPPYDQINDSVFLVTPTYDML